MFDAVVFAPKALLPTARLLPPVVLASKAFDPKAVFVDPVVFDFSASNPKVVGFDIFFTEKDKQSPDEIIKSYGLIPSDIVDLQKLRKKYENKIRR